MRILANTLLLLYLTTFVLSCKDDDSLTLPPATAIGAGTFGCLIDGTVYVPQGAYSEPLVQPARKMIVVSGGSINVNFVLVVRDTTDVIVENKSYYFNQETITCAYHSLNDKNDCDYRDTPVSGYIKFSKIDFPNNIFSGVFEFSAYSTLCSKSANITEGRFDIRADR
jgi:hypothetical protein